MTYPLQVAADYLRTGKVQQGFLAFVRTVKRIVTFTQERANRLTRFLAIVRAYKGGTPVKNIEEQYGCSRQTVLRYARLAGLPKRPKHFDQNIRRAVISLYRQGKPIAQIQAQLGVSQAYVSKTATEEGINRHRFGGRH